TATLITTQQLHTSPVLSIRARSAWTADDEDEIIIAYTDRTAVRIEGAGLADLVAVGPNGSPPQLAIKKWAFQVQETVSDLISLGPASGATMLLGGEPLGEAEVYNARFLVVGRPLMVVYATSDATRSSFVGIAATGLNVVRSAVFSLAKSFWGAVPSTPPPSDPTSTPPSPQPQTTTAPSIPMPPVGTIADQGRTAFSVAVAPADQASGRSGLAALADSLGRVVVVDLEMCIMIRMWKGIRDAQCAWTQVAKPHSPTANPATTARRTVLLLVVYAARGVLEIYRMRAGARIAAINVGTGMRLVQAPGGPTIGAAAAGWGEQGASALAGCFLVGPSGDVRKITVPWAAVAGPSATKKALVKIRSLAAQYEGSADDDVKRRIGGEIVDAVVGLGDAEMRIMALSALPPSLPLTSHQHLTSLLIAAADQPTSPRAPPQKADKTLALRSHLLALLARLARSETHVSESPFAADIASAFGSVVVEEEEEHVWRMPSVKAFLDPFRCAGAGAGDGAWVGVVRSGAEVAAAALVAAVGADGGGKIIREARICVDAWVTLITTHIDAHPLSTLLASPVHMNAIAAIAREAVASRDVGALFEWAWTSLKIGHAHLVSIILRAIATECPERAIDTYMQGLAEYSQSLYAATEQCWALTRGSADPIEDGLCAANLGKTERTTIPRLLAIHQVRFRMLQARDSHRAGEVAEAFSTTISRFKEVAASEVVNVYIAFEFGRVWTNEADP
ncbi:Rab3 GTPase-activating protein regulatory subunit N-terminus-domain-containing protein, partial [Blyttiomyces helicus]